MGAVFFEKQKCIPLVPFFFEKKKWMQCFFEKKCMIGQFPAD
jgi:hypothetical protein